MKKEIGFIGLGRMGLNMTIHLVEQGYRVVGYDPSESARESASKHGITVARDYPHMMELLGESKTIWIMVPSKFVDSVLAEVVPLLTPDEDIVIDGGNSFYKDSLRRHADLASKGIDFLDVGTSGGMDGARHGASIMIGGKKEVFEKTEHICAALAAQDGYALVGGEGAGHFVKMIHNGIEYGMMGAIAEGVALLHDHKEEFGIDLTQVFKPYEHESIITSKLLTWLKHAYDQGQVDAIEGEVPRGETEDEMEHITTLGDVKVLEAALAQRKVTREHPSYIGKLIAAMRNQFGGHSVIQK